MIKNLLYMLISNFVKLASTAVIFFILARVWGVEAFGQFTYCFAMIAIVQVILDYGFNLQVVKDISEDKKKAIDIIQKSLTVKHIITFTVYIFSWLMLVFYNKNSSFNVLYLLLLISVTLNSYANYFLYPSQAEEKFKIVSLVMLAYNISFVVIIGLALLFGYRTLTDIAAVFALARLVPFLICVFLIKKYYPAVQLLTLRTKGSWQYFKKSLSYGILVFFGMAYFQMDTLFINHFLGARQVGLYQAGVRILVASAFIVDVFNSVYLPKTISLKNNINKLIEYQSKTTHYFSLISLAAVSICVLFPSFITMLLYGKAYIELANYLPLFSLLITLRYIGSSYGLLVTVFDAQRLRCLLVGGALLVNVLLSIILIPRYFLYGGLLAALMTLIFLNFGYFMFSLYRVKSIYLKADTLLVLTALMASVLAFYFGLGSWLVALSLFLGWVAAIRKKDILFISRRLSLI
ncbi:oligosaccharide flippase family protein [Piscirickettsia salmonis]|uniref:oligosaccharide flippase family protein n=1 Tax=Piscirickettsia salmonis TaxID=1238 RepID=UPI00375343CD